MEAIELSPSDRLLQEQAFNKFREVFATTCLLVTAQYFENPYHEEEGLDELKRPFSPFSWEEEESIESGPSKKRKFSF